jgi:hypothetical protein
MIPRYVAQVVAEMAIIDEIDDRELRLAYMRRAAHRFREISEAIDRMIAKDELTIGVESSTGRKARF